MSPGLRPSKGTSVSTFIVTSDYDVANQKCVNVIMFNDLKCRDWRCCFVGVLPCSCLYCGCHRKTSAGTLVLIFFHKVLKSAVNCWLIEISVPKFVDIEPRLPELLVKMYHGPVFQTVHIQEDSSKLQTRYLWVSCTCDLAVGADMDLLTRTQWQKHHHSWIMITHSASICS